MTVWVMKAIVGAYFLTLLGLAVFGAHRYLVLWLFHRHRARRNAAPAAVFETPPVVTVQLPLFNELYVARRIIDAACAMDYPRDRFEVQVLDDSTDETRLLVDEAVAAWRERGVDAVVLRRPDRVGFKAGALEYGLARAKGEFIAVFDADFVPRSDFLTRTIPHLADPRIGMVQTRWEHINEDYSSLTRLQALFLDGHFVLEHAARNWSGRFFNFNGTAGVWRKSAIEDAGGWQHDTITEDLDLSYRAQMRGWKFQYLLDEGVPSELPVLMSAFRSQQFRWAKGSVETARKLLPALWRADLPTAVKLEATTHLSANFSYVLVTALCLLSGPALMARIHMGWRSIAWLDFALFFLVTVSITIFYGESRRRIGRSVWRALVTTPALMALGIGMAVNNGHAVWEGIRGRRTAFVRTAKHRIETRGDGVRGKRYGGTLDGKMLIEIALFAWFIPPILYAIHYRVWLSLPFQLLFAAGFGYVVGLNLWQTLRARVADRFSHATPARETTA